MSHLRVAFTLLAASALGAAPARAALTLDLAAITANEDDSGWHLRVALEGSGDIANASLAPSGGYLLSLNGGPAQRLPAC